MIPAHVIRQAEELLQRGNISHREIGSQLGISRGTVGRVAAGTVTSAKRQAREDSRGGITEVTPFRCDRCGGISTRFPCAKCYVESIQSSLRPLQVPATTIVRVELELLPEHQRRYEEVRRWRREAVRKRA